MGREGRWDPMFALHSQLSSTDYPTLSVPEPQLWPMNRTGLDFILLCWVFDPGANWRDVSELLDLLHKPGLSKPWIIHIETRVICIFYENMHLLLTSFRRRGQNTRSEDWYPHSTCNQSTHFLGWLLTCFLLGKNPWHFYESQRSMVKVLGLSTSSVM